MNKQQYNERIENIKAKWQFETITKEVDGYIYKLRHVGLVLYQIDCFMPNGYFSHVVAFGFLKDMHKIWNEISTYPAVLPTDWPKPSTDVDEQSLTIRQEQSLVREQATQDCEDNSYEYDEVV